MNSYKKGKLTFIAYPTEDKTYVVACVELCLLREGKDLESQKLKILGDAKKYLINVCKNKLGEHLLNQSLPKEIEKEFFNYRKQKKNDEFEQWRASIEKLKKKRNLELLIA